MNALLCHDTTTDETAILCRAYGAAPISAEAGEIVYLTAGLVEGVPSQKGKATPVQILVDAQTAAVLEQQRAAIVARGVRPYFDFNHDDEGASFWPAKFFWREGVGVIASGEFSRPGKEAIEGKVYRGFSPVCHPDDVRQRPTRIVCNPKAHPNMGGLVNNPAFKSLPPLFAKAEHHSSGSAAGENQNQHAEHIIMNETELAALRAKNQELQSEIDALKAKNADAAAIAAKQSEQRAVAAELQAEESRRETEALKAKNAQLESDAKARSKADAEAAVKRATERGAIAAKDTKTQDALVAKATDDPAFLSVIDAMQGQPALSGRITPSGVVVVAEAPTATLKAFSEILAKNAAIKLSHETHKDKGRLAREACALFAKDIENNPSLSDITIEEAIKAADVTDAQVGLLAGTLVLQRALPLLQYEYPILGAITSDFSDAPGLYGQTETTRIILKPAVQTYSTTPDSAGRPTGWSTVSPAQTVDVSVTLDAHVGVPIVFGVQTLAKTVRNLFGEVAPMALYALGGYAVDKLAALMTAANFNAYADVSEGGGETTDGSTAIVVTSTAGMYPGQAISGTGIPANTYVRSITSSTAAVITQAATATNTGLTFTLSGGKVPTTYATYVKALADFDVASIGEIKTAFDINEVPMQERFALLSSPYHTKLGNTPTLNSFFAAMQKPEIITKGILPEVQGFSPQNAPWFPSSSNRVGFAGHKASLLLKTRLPNDFTQAVGAMVPGSVTTVTAPGGISVLLVQYVSLQGNYAEWRPEVMIGAAVGERRAGLVLTSA